MPRALTRRSTPENAEANGSTLERDDLWWNRRSSLRAERSNPGVEASLKQPRRPAFLAHQQSNFKIVRQKSRRLGCFAPLAMTVDRFDQELFRSRV
jgi:hypothetical protein